MATFAGTLVFDSNPKSDKSAKSLVMNEEFFRHEWKDGDLLKVQVNDNGTVVFSHVTAVVRHVMVYAATAEEALDSASRAFPR